MWIVRKFALLLIFHLVLNPIDGFSASRPRRWREQQSAIDAPNERRQQSLEKGNDPLLSLNLNLDALARAQAAERAQELYQRISALHKEGYYDTTPDIVSFNSVLKAWRSNPVKALEFWEAEAAALGRQIDVISYNTFLLALARAGLHEPAESLLRQMQGINAAVRPDRISWNTVLLAYATAVSDQDESAAELSEKLIREMMGAHEEDRIEQASEDSFGLPSELDQSYITPTPDATSFNTVISAWSEYRDKDVAAKRSELWLREMQQSDFAQPDVYSYTTVLKALLRCGGDEAVKRGLQLLKELEESESAQPNRVTMTIVMQMLCENQQPEAAEKLLERMQKRFDLQPDTTAYSALIDGWAFYAAKNASKVNDIGKQCVRAAFRILLQMKDLPRPEQQPNQQTYTCVLKCLANAQLFESGEIAKQVLREMWDTTSPTSTSRSTPPTTIHYNAALNCCAKAPRASKAIDAADLWSEMLERGVDCDIVSYNTVLDAAANAFGSADVKRKSLQIGLQFFETLQTDHACEPTSLTYSYYFKLLRRLLPQSASDRLSSFQAAFDSCCEHGCLNEVVWKQLMNSLSNEEAYALLRNHWTEGSHDRWQVRLADLPPNWSRQAMTYRKDR